MTDLDVFEDKLRELLANHDDHSDAVHTVYQMLENADLISKVTVHKYLCKQRGCKLATALRLGTFTLIRTRDTKKSPGLNQATSVEAARAARTLDGHRHWPGHTIDVGDLAKFGHGVGVEIACSHVRQVVAAEDIMADTEGVTPGQPGPPTRI